ncbi:hypothetical protein PLEOSDRAFT_1100124 [Pleurotus ostreatus PC15]|uniref:Uncharacterized protein n=1 Tax=Pleurotus ostreatus (strain PC15) TaxID=1137138 RepID=A0A067P4L4_PLEO1|nr:hypothetical protein PLEOSDRAFT_1100124 [Pleurotus ostreatus PC15]
MTPSPEPAFVLPNPERSLPGHRSQSFSSTPPGLLCSIDFEASSFHLDSNPSIFGPFTEKRDPRSCDQSDIDSTTVAYPSPPPTNSNPKRSVPLPAITFHSGCGSKCFVFGSVNTKAVMGPGGIPSPPDIQQIPISPPPTIHTTIHALPTLHDATTPLILPPTPEEEEAQIIDDSDDSILTFPPIPEEDEYQSDEAVDSPAAAPTLSELPDAQLLSPLSPEWTPTGIADFLLPQDDDDYSLLSNDGGPFSLRRSLHSHGPFSPPFLAPLNIPTGEAGPSHDHGMEDDVDSSPEDPESLFTPRTPESIEVPLLGNDVGFLSKLDFDCMDEEDHIQISHPSSPSISTHNLPELDFDDDDVQPSPPLSLISLPGAETDDDLLPADLALNSYHPDSPASTSSLLLTDSSPGGPTLSTETSDPDANLGSHLAVALANSNDPLLERLYAVRMRAISAERAARQKEAAALEQGSIFVRAEAKREKKKEKERAREVAALLRLKLGLVDQERSGTVDLPPVGDLDVDMEERAGIDGVVKKKKKKSKGMAGNIDGLVARMMFRRRNESFKPLGGRQPETGRELPRARSSLSRTSSWKDDDDDADVTMGAAEDGEIIPSREKLDDFADQSPNTSMDRATGKI